MKLNDAVHPSAVVSPQAKLGNNVRVGPFSVIGPDVEVGDDVEIQSHVVIDGITTIGSGCTIYPFAAIGQVNQDLKYKGERSSVVIGENTTIREHATIQRGTKEGGMVTRVGSNCLLMVGVHIAHDCCVGNHVIMANQVMLGGHVRVGDRVVIGGMSAVHQHVRIGERAMIGGMSGVERDVFPFSLVSSDRATLRGLNLVGLKRSGLDRKDMKALKRWLDAVLNGEMKAVDFLAKLESSDASEATKAILSAFLSERSKRGYCF